MPLPPETTEVSCMHCHIVLIFQKHCLRTILQGVMYIATATAKCLKIHINMLLQHHLGRHLAGRTLTDVTMNPDAMNSKGLPGSSHRLGSLIESGKGTDGDKSLLVHAYREAVHASHRSSIHMPSCQLSKSPSACLSLAQST